MKYCEHIAHTLSFNINDILPCCTANNEKAPKHYNNVNQDENYLKNLNIDDSKKSILEELNTTNLEKYSCANCIFLKDSDEDINAEKKINSIFLRHWTQCNCDCIYCDNKRGEFFGLPPQYSPYNFIKKLYEENKIDTKNLTVRIQGGDLSVLPDFEDFMALFEKYGFKEIHFSTNNIIYQPSIERILFKQKGSLNTSLDCGTKETYLKLKQCDCFDAVVNNLKKYSQISNSYVPITVHYIIVKDYNDNKKEINEFIKLMRNIGIKNLGIRIDHKDLNNFLSNKKTDASINHYKKLISYFYKETKKYNIHIDGDDYIEQNFVLNKMKKNDSLLTKLFNFMIKSKC